MKSPVYRPLYKFTRTVEGVFDVTTDGINPALVGQTYRLNQLPNSTDFTNLFDMFRIAKIEVEWYPEYTELTDAAPLSNAVNVRFNSAIDPTDGSAPSSVNDLLEYSTLKSTGVTKVHKLSFVPSILMSGTPCSCMVPSSAPATPHYAVKIAVQPTGVAMVFRSRAKFYLECANVK